MKRCLLSVGFVLATILCTSLVQAQVVVNTVYNPVDFNFGQPVWVPANQVENTCAAIGPQQVGARVVVANLSGGLWHTDGVGLYTACPLAANRSIGLTTGTVVDTPAGLSVAVDRVVTVRPQFFWGGQKVSILQLAPAGTVGSYRSFVYATSTAHKADAEKRAKREEEDKKVDANKAPAQAEDPKAGENNTLPFGPAAPGAAPAAPGAAPAVAPPMNPFGM